MAGYHSTPRIHDCDTGSVFADAIRLVDYQVAPGTEFAEILVYGSDATKKDTLLTTSASDWTSCIFYQPDRNLAYNENGKRPWVTLLRRGL